MRKTVDQIVIISKISTYREKQLIKKKILERHYVCVCVCAHMRVGGAVVKNLPANAGDTGDRCGFDP